MKVTKMCVIIIVVVLLGPCVSAQNRVLGGIFYENADDMKEALALSGKTFNFSISVKEVSNKGDILEISNHVCALAEEGVMGIIDGVGGRASENIQAICDFLELPHILIQHTDTYAKNWSSLNLHPSPSVYNVALKQLIEYKEWRNFTILYARGHTVLRVRDLLEIGNNTERYTITVRELNGDDYRDILINAKLSGYTNFVVDIPSEHLEQLLAQAQQVGLMADEHSYIFVSPDLFTLDMDRYRYGGVNMTGLRLVNLTENEMLWDFTARFNEQSGNTYEPEQIKTKMLLLHDIVQIYDTALQKIRTNIEIKKLSCENHEYYDYWTYGSSLLNFMRTNKVTGITGPLTFNGMGQRSDVSFEILELTTAGNQTIGRWSDGELNIRRPFVTDAEIGEETILKNKTLKVLIATIYTGQKDKSVWVHTYTDLSIETAMDTAPYGYLKESPIKLEGNDRYEGFTVDLIEKLSELLGFNYEFEIEPVYGNWKDGKFNGMVGKLIEDKADLALCDFTITAERQSGIDFSTPFMTLGIGILYKEPRKQPPEMFSFMAVFSKEVWINMLLIQLGLGVVMIFVGRISQKEWQNPVPCVEQPEELTNQFSFANSLWLIIGSVMQQGSEIAPIALAPRMITSVWWFFTLVMVASYVGTLVAFLTIEKNVLPFETVEELYNHKSIAYGAKDIGSTVAFFRDSDSPTYRAMYDKMVKNKWLVGENDDGVAYAENTTYAFFMESTSIEYYKERHCDLLQVGDLLDSKSYGIGMKRNSPLKKHIDDALLVLKEHGELQKLKDIWWKEKRGGGKCGKKREEDQKQLGMKNMLGAFVVLGAGCGFGLIISVLDMFWGVFKRSIKYGTSFKFELVEELKFALTFSGSEKPVKRKVSTTDGSAEALAEAEGKDEVRSLKSIHSGKSTDTHRTCHSHHSRHSSRSLSVAFAKRRSYS